MADDLAAEEADRETVRTDRPRRNQAHPGLGLMSAATVAGVTAAAALLARLAR